MRATLLGQRAGSTQNDDQESRCFVSRPSAPETQANCKRCKRAFKRERVEQKYCNARCRNAAVKARLRARSGDKKPSKRHLVLPHREAVTNGQKKPVKTKAFFDPLTVNFRRPVVDLLQRGDELRRHVVAIECATYPPICRPLAYVTDYTAPLSGDDVEFKFHNDGYPALPVFLDRRREQ